MYSILWISLCPFIRSLKDQAFLLLMQPNLSIFRFLTNTIEFYLKSISLPKALKIFFYVISFYFYV